MNKTLPSEIMIDSFDSSSMFSLLICLNGTSKGQFASHYHPRAIEVTEVV